MQHIDSMFAKFKAHIFEDKVEVSKADFLQKSQSILSFDP